MWPIATQFVSSLLTNFSNSLAIQQAVKSSPKNKQKNNHKLLHLSDVQNPLCQ